MKRLGTLLIAIATISLCMPVWACVEPDVPSFKASLDSAETVVILRILSTGLIDREQNTRDTAGQIEVIRTLRGESQFRYFRHDAVWCGGLRLSVGRYYLVATNQSGPVLTLMRGDRSIVDISEDYSRTYPEKPPEQLWQTQIENYLEGRPLPKNFDPSSIMERVQAFPPLPGQVW